MVGGGRHTWLKRLGCVYLLFVINIVIVVVLNFLIKVIIFVTKIAATFRHRDIYFNFVFKLEKNYSCV